MRISSIASIATALSALAVPLMAQDWPNKPVTMIVPYAAGGPVDTIGRIIASGLTSTLGQQVIVENVPGAGGMTGASRVARATPDGSIFLLGGIATLALVPSLYKTPLYKPAADFAPVALIADSARLLVTRKDFPANTLREFVAYAKVNSQKMQFASAGAGTGSHICAALLNLAMGTNIIHIPYRGTGPALQDMIAGRVDFICDQISTSLPQVEAGAVKAIATFGVERVPQLPNVATAKEQGVDLDCSAWAALVFPKGTPDATVRRLNKATNDALESPHLRQRMEDLGMSIPAPDRRTPEYLAAFVPAEIDKWEGPIKASGITGELQIPFVFLLKSLLREIDNMNLTRRRILHLIAGVNALPVLSRIARAQTYPTRPVRLIVGFPAGSRAFAASAPTRGRRGQSRPAGAVQSALDRIEGALIAEVLDLLKWDLESAEAS